MKKYLVIASILFLTILLISCKKEENISKTNNSSTQSVSAAESSQSLSSSSEAVCSSETNNSANSEARASSPNTAKPVIYLYPTTKQNVSVKLSYNGELLYTYPKYNNGWSVTAFPDGKILNEADNKEYSYLFWEGIPNNTVWDLSKGYAVKGEDTIKFLQNKLSELGLTPKEYNEFIVYWLPFMENNKYNLITFQTKAYENLAQLDITPKPDSILRVFMAFKPLDKPINIEPPTITPFERKGFTVVEWGGTEIK